jgi:CRAL/TRIO, N-terminal domain
MLARFKSAIQTASGNDAEQPHDEDDSLSKLRSVIHADPGLDGDQSAWADDACMLRFIRAAKFNHEAAVRRLRATLAWRAPQTSRCFAAKPFAGKCLCSLPRTRPAGP